MSERGLHAALKNMTLSVNHLLKIAECIDVSPIIFFVDVNRYSNDENIMIANDGQVYYQVKKMNSKESEALLDKIKNLEELLKAKDEIIALIKDQKTK